MRFEIQMAWAFPTTELCYRMGTEIGIVMVRG